MQILVRRAPAAEVKKTLFFEGRAQPKYVNIKCCAEKRKKTESLEMLIFYLFLQYILLCRIFAKRRKRDEGMRGAAGKTL